MDPLYNKNFTYTLAELDNDGELAAQEACYYGCGAQILTNTAKADLTALDAALPFLSSAGFFEDGKTYFVDIQMRKELLMKAKQSIPPDNRNQTSPASSQAPSPTVSSLVTEPNQTNVASTVAASPVSSELIRSSSASRAMATPSASSGAQETPNSSIAVAKTFRINAMHYLVAVPSDIRYYEDATSACEQVQHTMGGFLVNNRDVLLGHLKETEYSKIVIGSWNGDNYGSKGDMCLMVQIDTGNIFQDICTGADAVLCQKK
ncbi:hypothetical protein DFQ28_009060 [Apophysomyces sp. BC1034]|nr:hypothetical protein DFQ30_005613 [Apophysomyces sp. BC1015]KAG0185615.1 hypothetical protein DFQ28_009060 [Apophysomyces sp. BC1034]